MFVRFKQPTLPKRTVAEQAPFNRFDVCHSFDFEYVGRGIRRRPERNPPPRLQKYAICLYNITSFSSVVGCMCKHTSCEIHLPHCSDLVRRLASYSRIPSVLTQLGEIQYSLLLICVSRHLKQTNLMAHSRMCTIRHHGS